MHYWKYDREKFIVYLTPFYYLFTCGISIIVYLTLFYYLFALNEVMDMSAKICIFKEGIWETSTSSTPMCMPIRYACTCHSEFPVQY
jgi:hypothetical protein